MLKSQGMRRWAGDTQLWCPVGADKSPPAQPQERTISTMRQTCHLSQSYYTERKQAHLPYFQFKCINKWDRKCTIWFFQAEGKRSTRCEENEGKAKTKARKTVLKQVYLPNWLYQMQSPVVFFYFFVCLSSFVKQRLTWADVKLKSVWSLPSKQKTLCIPNPNHFCPC